MYPTQSSAGADPRLLLITRQRIVIAACRKFLEQMKAKGIGLTFAERTACNLILDSIERLDNS